jgi:hypothetical protein
MKMKNLIIILVLSILMTACNLFGFKEKQAIEICQKAKVQFGMGYLTQLFEVQLSGLTENATWLDYANMLAKKEPNKKLDWSAIKTEDNDIYVVAFTDKDGWGYRWEVSIKQQIVKDINSNEYLSRKYDISCLDRNRNFQITDIEKKTINLDKEKNYYSLSKTNKIFCILKASVINKTGKTLSSSAISGKFQLIFKDKTIEGDSNWESGFITKNSKSNTWYPNTKRDFYIRTKGIDDIYLNYEPEYTFFIITIIAEDPIGFSYNKAIKEYNLNENWKLLKQSAKSKKLISI